MRRTKSIGQSDPETVCPQRLGCCAIRRDGPATDVRELGSVNADNASGSDAKTLHRFRRLMGQAAAGDVKLLPFNGSENGSEEKAQRAVFLKSAILMSGSARHYVGRRKER
jgi:hypothetical protein